MSERQKNDSLPPTKKENTDKLVNVTETVVTYREENNLSNSLECLVIDGENRRTNMYLAEVS